MAIPTILRWLKLLTVLSLFVQSTNGVVGLDEPYISDTFCPINCSCILNEVACKHWTTSDKGTQGRTSIPSHTQSLSFTSVPDHNFNGTVSLQGLNELRWLRISNEELFSFPSLPSLPTLVYLDISDNKIQSLFSSDLNNTLHIIHLNLSGNGLQSVESDSLNGLGELKVLDISRNPNLFELPSNFFIGALNLMFLDASKTSISSFPNEWTKDLQQLHFLNLSYNYLTPLPQMNLPSLEVLDLSHNPLIHLPELAGFPYLRELFASHTFISNFKTFNTEGCTRLEILDISHSNLANLDEGILGHCKNLRTINLSHNRNLWRIEHGALSELKNLTILKLNNCPKLYDIEDDSLNGLNNLRELNLQESGIKVLPFSFNQLKNLTTLNILGTTLLCDCHAYWLPDLLRVSNNHSWKGVDTIHCSDGIDRTPDAISNHLNELECAEVEINTPPYQWVLASWGNSALLECNATGNPAPRVIWQTVDLHLHVYNKSLAEYPWVHHHIAEVLSVAKSQADGKFEVLQSGQLLIRDVTREDIGRYKCFAFNPVSNASSITFLGLEDLAFRVLILESILFGFACAALFLLITLLVQFIKFIMERLGWECCCCKNRLSPKAKQIRQLIESVETYKSAQLEKLKDNYTSQVVSIKDSCYQQMEKLRDSYANQSKNLKDLCDYSTQQITGARDQYLDQVNKVRDYSMGQMNRVRENYVFQRHRIRKFSGHQLLRLRETYKYQQKTLNKLLETLPDLYIQNCRTGVCQRADSIIFDDEIDGLDVYYKVDFLDVQSYCSDYYTPNSTLTRHSKGGKTGHSRNASSISGGTEYQETHSYITRQESIGSERSDHQRLHTRSYSIATPPSIHRFDSSRGHKRSISASSHQFLPKAHLMDETRPSPPSTPKSDAPKLAKGQSFHPPLTLTPVHEGKYPKENTLPQSAVPSTSKLEPTEKHVLVNNSKPEVQSKVDCDTERETSCDTLEVNNLKTVKVPYQTSL